MSRMRLSDGLVLSGYPIKSCQKDSKTKPTVMPNDELLNSALRTVVNAGCNVNSVQVELLKGALAGNVYSNGLTATAEHILSTICNPNWIDREIMRQFFLEQVGFGSELSLRSGSMCVERGIPSPQRLSMLFHTMDSPTWLRLTEEDEVLLRIALSPYVEKQRVHQAACERSDRSADSVWADVDSDLDSNTSASTGEDDSQETWFPWAKSEAIVMTAPVNTHSIDATPIDTIPSDAGQCSKAPPPTPTESPLDTAIASVREAIGCEELASASPQSTSSIASFGVLSVMSEGSCATQEYRKLEHVSTLDEKLQAWPLALVHPSELESADTFTVDSTLSVLTLGAPAPLREDEVVPCETEPLPPQEEEEDDEEDGYMSSYGSCCTFQPTTATVEGYLTRTPSAHSLLQDEVQCCALSYENDGISPYDSCVLEIEEQDLSVSRTDWSPRSPLTASATSSVTDTGLDFECLQGEQWYARVQQVFGTVTSNDVHVPTRAAENY